jgi:autotransporter-associated beta strand repeat/autotransporter-associated beta strand repeat/autotransporter-associated beta strand repeat/autotransporter-associated beta strand repeat
VVSVPGDTAPTTGGNVGDLRFTLNDINVNPGPYSVTFNLGGSNVISLQGMLPILNLNASSTISIDGTNGGNEIQIFGSNLYPGLIVRQGDVTLQNLQISNTLAAGGTGNGGGLGAGAGLFLIGGKTTVSNLTFNTNVATGGSWVNTNGGGGMFRGNANIGGDSGGGMGGQGSTSTGGGGGGIGPGGNGGNNNAVGIQGGGIGAALQPGGTGESGANAGGNYGGGGGGGNNTTLAGGGGGINGSANTGSTGGAGGFGGGGAATAVTVIGNAGNGGFGGGGGGSVFNSANNVTCGSGGFGGGGGSAILKASFPGFGGFGGGAGVTSLSAGGSGIGGSFPGGGQGGAGAGLGGAIFVNVADTAAKPAYYGNPNNTPTPGAGGGGGAQLIIAGPISITGSAVNPGTSTNNGAAIGPDIFATTGSSAVFFNIPAGPDLTYSNTIADDSSNSMPGGTYVAGTGAGAEVTNQGAGKLILTGTSKYSGGTKLSGGILQAVTPGCMGNTASPVTFSGSATLQCGTPGLTLAYPIVVASLGTIDTNAQTLTLTGLITGTELLTVTGGTVSTPGFLHLTNTLNTHSGGTIVTANTELYGPPGAVQGNINNSGIVDFEQALGTGFYTGIISGGGITAINGIAGGTGTVAFTKAQTYTLQTAIAAGTLALTGLGSISSAAELQIASGATFDISGVTATSSTVGELIGSGTINLGGKTLITNTEMTPATYGGVFTGNALSGFTKQGSGLLTLTTPSPAFLGTTTVSAGTLQINPNTLVTNIVNNANLDFEQTAGIGTFAKNISGTGNVQINSIPTNTGTVEFTGLNSYTGTTTVTTGNLIFNQSLTNTLTGPFILNTGTTVDFDQLFGSTGTYSGNFSGAGNISINQLGNTGTVILSGTLANSGTTHVYFGTLEILNSTTSTSSTNFIVDTGAILDLEQVGATTGSYTGNITGGGSVVINTAPNIGTVILKGTNSYTGPTTVANGTLEISSNVNSSSFVSPITVNAGAFLDLEQGANTMGTYSGGISGAGTLEINGAGSTGTVFLSGPIAAFTGPTFVIAGTLAGAPTDLPQFQPIKVNTGATVDFEQVAGSGTFAGSIQDNGVGQHGALAINRMGGVGTIVLSGIDSYTGGTTVFGGTLQGNVASLVGNIAVNTNASVDIEQVAGSGTFTGTISNNGSGQQGVVTINKQGGAGTVIYAGAQTYTGGTTIFNGTLQTQPAFVLGNVSINTGATLDLEQPSSSGTFSGNISGNGTVVVNSVGGNTGTVILTGTNNYTGGTFVNGGTLQGDTNSLFGTITDNAKVKFTQSFDGTFNGTFLGAGTIDVTGNGLLRFDSSNAAFTGTTNIDHGRLALNSFLGGNVNIKSLGHLSGNGTVLGNVIVEAGGIIRPGNGNIGTFNIGGNYQQKNLSIYDVLINGAGQSSLLNIAGQAALDAGSILNVTVLNGVPAINTVYTIVSATAGVNGTYSTTLIDNPLIAPVVTYDAQHVYLTLNANFPFIALTYNQKQVAKQLATLDNNASPELKAILVQLVTGTIEEARSSLSQMSAEQYTNVIMTAELANHQFIRRLYDPLRSIITTNPCKKTVCCNYEQKFDVWSSVSGGRAYIHGNDNARGFRISDFEVSVGAQTTLPNRFTVGFAVSYEKDTLGYKVGGSGTCNTVLGAAYTLYRAKRFYALADIILGYSQNKMRRTIDVGNLHYKPHGNPKTYQGSIYTEVGTDFAFNNTLIQPFLGLEWGYYRFNGLTESGGSPLNVFISSKGKSNAYSRVGMHITSPPIRCGFSMGLDLAWIYRLTSLENNITVQFQDFGTAFNIKGLPFNRNSFEGILRFNQPLFGNWDAFFEASCQGWNNSTAYSFIAGVKSTW